MVSPWLFKVYMDEVMKEVKARIFDRVAELVHDGGRWSIAYLLYASDTVLTTDSDSKPG